jgi:hypothetical protein
MRFLYGGELVKKYDPTAKITIKSQKPYQLLISYVQLVHWMGQGFEGFLHLREKIFFLSRNTRGYLATAVRFFLKQSDINNMLEISDSQATVVVPLYV